MRGQLVSTPGSWSAAPSTSRSTTTSRSRSASATARRATSSSSPIGNFYEPAGPATIQTRTVSAVDGALGTAADMTSSSNTNVPEVTYNSKNNQFLLSWWQASPGLGHLLRAAS